MDAVAALPSGGGLIGAACAALGLSRASLHRRTAAARRPPAPTRARPRPARALAPPERRAVLELLREPRFVDQAPAEVYAELLDQGLYLCSIRTMYRILDDTGEAKERRQLLRHPVYKKPELIAKGPNQVWSWDITKLMGPVKWTYFYLYVIIDIFSRRAVAWQVADTESAALFKPLFEDAVAKHGVLSGQLTLHADRGPSMKAKATALLLADLGVTKSHSRPYTSNDNPFSESLFKTCKYQPRFPQRFGSIQDAKAFCRSFFRVVQRRTPPSRNRPDDPEPGPLRTGRRNLRRPKTDPRNRLPRQPQPLREKHPLAAPKTNRRLDQSAPNQARNPSLNSQPRRLIVVDTFRARRGSELRSHSCSRRPPRSPATTRRSGWPS